jgi:hypothetical protein
MIAEPIAIPMAAHSTHRRMSEPARSRTPKPRGATVRRWSRSLS